MKFKIYKKQYLNKIKTETLGIGIFENGILSNAAEMINDLSNGVLKNIILNEFNGHIGDIIILRGIEGIIAQNIVLIGLGCKQKYNIKTLYRTEYKFLMVCEYLNVTECISTFTNNFIYEFKIKDKIRNAIISSGTAIYKYIKFGRKHQKYQTKIKKIIYIVEEYDIEQAKIGLIEGKYILYGIFLSRTLSNIPGNICTPNYLKETAKNLKNKYKNINVKCFNSKKLYKLGMNAFLSVSQGSEEPICFIELQYNKKIKDSLKVKGPIVLIGKGITFDSGGISLKPADGMNEMKYDMCGASIILGIFLSLSNIKLPIHVIGLIGACENLPGFRANKPGDVIKSMSGKYIEIINTDAEGRLVLCDLLSYAKHFNPYAVIDIATLTGACVVALGNVHSGLFSTNEFLANSLINAGKKSMDSIWRLPIDKEYKKKIKSYIADLTNSNGNLAGATTAACFLSMFSSYYPWAHLDIAGTAWKNKKGSTGRCIPLIVQFLLDMVL